jgi:guanyl-specific ribonuclease Sa
MSQAHDHDAPSEGRSPDRRPRTNAAGTDTSPGAQVARLQQLAGNRAVAGLMRAQAAEAEVETEQAGSSVQRSTEPAPLSVQRAPTVASIPVMSGKPPYKDGLTAADIIAQAVDKKPGKGLTVGQISGGGTFGNREGWYPTADDKGNAITYREYDIKKYDGTNRGGERIVVGSDGTYYYSSDHYKNPQRFTP